MKRYSLMVRGKRKEWSFEIQAEPEHVEEWREDGLHVDELIAVIPQWAVDLGLMSAWMRIEETIRRLNGG